MARALILGGWLVALAGCVTLPTLLPEPGTAEVASHPFGAPPPAAGRPRVSFKPGSTEVAWRVDEVGRKLVGANPQLGMRPLFATIGSPDPEVFHAGTDVVYVTQGLVQKCPTEADLAAVLAAELGKMVSDREATASKDVRDPRRLPPIQLPIGGNGYDSAADPTNYIELAKYEKQHPKGRPLTRPDPGHVARNLLEQAGYKGADLDAAAPILRGAEQNCAIENQFKGTPAQGNWQR